MGLKAASIGFLRRDDGATAVEFALIAVPFLALLLFSIQVTIIFFADQALMTFNESISRNILTGGTQKLGLTQAQFKAQVCAKLPSLFSCNRLYLDVRSATVFSNANTSTPTMTYDASGKVSNTFQYDPGGPGSIVVVKMMYLWPVVGTLLGTLSNQANNNWLVMSTVALKSEQYAS